MGCGALVPSQRKSPPPSGAAKLHSAHNLRASRPPVLDSLATLPTRYSVPFGVLPDFRSWQRWQVLRLVLTIADTAGAESI